MAKEKVCVVESDHGTDTGILQVGLVVQLT